LQNDQSARYTDSESSLENQIGQLDDQISTANSQIITLSKAETPDTAAIAQLETNLAQFQQSRSYLVQSYETVRLAEAQSNNIVIQKEPAVPNKSPISPMPLKSALLSALVGLLIAGGIVFLIELLEDTIRDPEEITRKWGIPVLGLIANYNTKNSPIITINQPRSPISESFRSLRTNLQFAGAASPIHSLLVTSASPEDGKTSLVANLAVVLAQNERDVIVIDGDLRKPRIHKIFQLSNRIGLSDYFLHTQDKLNGLVKKTGITGLNVITSGGLPPNPSELLNSEKMVEVIHLLATHFDTVIIDTPPLLAVTDALVLSPRVDAVILVIDPNKTKRASIRHAIEQLRRVNANLVGVVLNNVKNKRSSYYYHRGYYYGKEYGRESGSFELIPDSVNEGENVDSIKHQKE
jgi:non-specific protein-tyrosine kinase